MKKLMMFAAAVTIVGGAYANDCFDPGQTGEVPCGIPVWTFKASGKTADLEPKKELYKTVQSLKATGYLVGNVVGTTAQEIIDNGDGTATTNVIETGDCCLESFDVYIYEKSEKAYWLYEAQDVAKVTVFGKNYDTVLKPGKSTSVESDILWTLTDDNVMALQFVGFGKGKRYMSKDKPNTDPCGDNSVDGCEESYDWPNWNGWFTGWLDDDFNPFDSLSCEEPCETVAGGTWSAKYNKKLSDRNITFRVIENN